jgi:hypothetical protein
MSASTERVISDLERLADYGKVDEAQRSVLRHAAELLTHASSRELAGLSSLDALLALFADPKRFKAQRDEFANAAAEVRKLIAESDGRAREDRAAAQKALTEAQSKLADADRRLAEADAKATLVDRDAKRVAADVKTLEEQSRHLDQRARELDVFRDMLDTREANVREEQARIDATMAKFRTSRAELAEKVQ